MKTILLMKLVDFLIDIYQAYRAKKYVKEQDKFGLPVNLNELGNTTRVRGKIKNARGKINPFLKVIDGVINYDAAIDRDIVTSDNRAVHEKKVLSGDWTPPKEAEIYLPAIDAASAEFDLPENLLARVAYQESRFRPDIIEGETVSSAGAMGIMQIVPKWHPDVDPLDPFESIQYAAKYLRTLYNRFGNWKQALAAYNYGQGNVSKRPKFTQWPLETRNYVTEIGGDIGLA